MCILLKGCCILMPEFCSDEAESEAKKEYNMIQNWYFSFTTPIRGAYLEFDCNQNINNAKDNDSLDYPKGNIKGYNNGYSLQEDSYKGQYYTTDKITYRCDSFFTNNKFIELRRVAIIKCAKYSYSKIKHKIGNINITYSTIQSLQKDYFILDNSIDNVINNDYKEINCETNAMGLIESGSLKDSIVIPIFIKELVNAEVERLLIEYLTIGTKKYKNIIVNFEASDDLSDKKKKIWASNYNRNDITGTGFIQISTFLLRAVILKNIDKYGFKILNKSNRHLTPIKLIVGNEELITNPNEIFAENDPGIEVYKALVNEDDIFIERNKFVINSAFEHIVAGIKTDIEFIILHELSHLFFELGYTISEEQACDCIAYSISNSKDIGVFKYLFQDAIIKNKDYFLGKDTTILDQLKNRIYQIQKGAYSNIKSTNECLTRKY